MPDEKKAEADVVADVVEVEEATSEAGHAVAKWAVEFENGVKVEVHAISGSRAVATARRVLHDLAEKVAVATQQ